jgi:hypothetical protein
VALPGLCFTVTFMLSYKGSPLAAIAHVDAEGSPVMFCIIADDAPDASMRARSGAASFRSLLGHAEDAAIW